MAGREVRRKSYRAIRIREANERDIPSIIGLINHAANGLNIERVNKQRVQKYLKSGLFLVGEGKDNSVVGLTYNPIFDEIGIAKGITVVKKRHRGKGIGTELEMTKDRVFQALANELKQELVRQEWAVSAAGKRLMEKQGFKTSSKHYKPGELIKLSKEERALLKKVLERFKLAE